MSINNKNFIKIIFSKNNFIYLKDKKYILLVLVILLGFSVFFKIFPLSKLFLTKKIEMIISKNNDNIKDLYMKRNISYTNKYLIDKIDFEQGQELKHATLGILGFTTDFFIDFKTKMIVSEDNNYKFIVYSDDGFNLFINNELVMDFAHDRPYARSEKDFFLKKGIYDLTLSYYQGYGNLGLKAYYQTPESDQLYFIGESSQFINFKI